MLDLHIEKIGELAVVEAADMLTKQVIVAAN